MQTIRRSQTTRTLTQGYLSLPVSETPHVCVCVKSPYRLRQMNRVGTGRDTKFILAYMKLIIGAPTNDGSTQPAILWQVLDPSTGKVTFQFNSEIVGLTGTETPADVFAKAVSSVIADALLCGYTVTADDLLWPPVPAAVTPSSYQTIVTQTGTSAPAVSGSLSPVSTYPAGTTFTWARTGAGVYTLTASTAVFNTSGKTGVFVSQLQNLNANVKAVVTSTTVITVTTAVQSVAVLGLLGLTTTNTDALLAQTMLYVQTYA